MRSDVEALFHAYADDVRQFLSTLVPVDDLDDCVSEVFVAAIRRHPRIPEPELAWLLRQAVAIARRVLRQRDAQLGPALRQDRPVDPGERERLDEVADALSSLSPGDREALGLAVLGLESDEAAAICGCTPQAFRVRLHRARTRLKRTLEVGADSYLEGSAK